MTGTTHLSSRVGFQQRVLPAYRTGFFDLLAQHCPDGLGLFAGKPLPAEEIPANVDLQFAQLFPARNLNFRDPSSGLYLCWQTNLLTWLEQWDPQVLILEANPRILSSRLAIRWMHRRRRPVIGWGLGAPRIYGLFSSLRNWERYSFLSLLDGLIAYSKPGAEEYRQILAHRDRSIPVFVAPNAVVPRPTNPLKERQLDTFSTAKIIFVGRLQHRKRIDILLRACASLPEEIRPHVTIVGDGPAREDLISLAQSIYLNTEFTGGRHGRDLEDLFDRADLFVLPGTGGLAVQQAMSHGLPVVVAQGDGTQNDLVRPENGWLVPPGDVEILAKTLRSALADRSRLREMGRKSFRIVQNESNLEQMVEVFLLAIQQVRNA